MGGREIETNLSITKGTHIVRSRTLSKEGSRHQAALEKNGTVQYSTVQYSTVQYSTVQYSTVQYM